MTVVVLKLVNGEEVISEKQDDGMYKRPRIFHIMQDGNGMRAALMPYLMSGPELTVGINKDLIITEAEAPHEITESYLQHVSGLVLSKSIG